MGRNGDRESGGHRHSGLHTLGGRFFRSVPIDRLDRILSAPGPESAGRYHRLGQPALYMSPALEWAIIAVSGYIREDGIRRVVVPLQVGDAAILDQRDEDMCRHFGIDRELSNTPWRPALADGDEPLSWKNSDAARNAGADGIIDRSRKIPDGWHVTLFRWNSLGGPSVEVAGDPVEITLSADGPKWGL